MFHMSSLVYLALMFVPGGTVLSVAYYLIKNKKLGAQHLTPKDVIEHQAPVHGWGFQHLATRAQIQAQRDAQAAAQTATQAKPASTTPKNEDTK